jgi:hypothetical protein
MCPGINLTRDFTHSSIAALLLGWDWEIEAGGMVFKHVPVCRLCVIGYPTVLVLCSLFVPNDVFMVMLFYMLHFPQKAKGRAAYENHAEIGPGIFLGRCYCYTTTILQAK